MVFDRRGHGQSPPLNRPRTKDYLSEEAAAVSGYLASERDTILIGHSDGGTLALGVDMRPRGIVTIAAHVLVEKETRAGIRIALDAYRTGLREKLMRYHGDKTDLLFACWSGVWLSPEFDSWNMRAELPRVRCPVLALQGDRDEYGTGAQLAAIESGVSGPVETLLIAGAAHEPHFQVPEATCAAILRSISAWT